MKNVLFCSTSLVASFFYSQIASASLDLVCVAEEESAFNSPLKFTISDNWMTADLHDAHSQEVEVL